ncbi:MAG: efflux transporter outer membrane subunit [Salinisphaeraceae bacterium]|nr:efflux transporter outer membrane subunit [Salinisphaeraceae bacterium]
MPQLFAKHYSVVLSLFLITGCASVSVSDAPDLPVQAPAEWAGQSQVDGDVNGWLKTFNDAELQALVNQAVDLESGNFNLRSVASRVRAAQAQQQITNANRWPQLAAVLTGARSKQEVNGVEVKGNDFGLQAQLSWELDLWGRLSNQTQAAFFDYRASEADLAALRLSLAANVARGWYDAISALRQQQLAEETATSFAQSLAVIEERYRSGIGDALDVSFARANAASAQSQLEARRIQADNAVLALETLLGQYPSRQLAVASELPALAAAPSSGVPAQLVERRPDVQAARLRLLAEMSRNEAVQRNWLPGLNLTGFNGTSTDDFGDVFDLDNLAWRIAAQLTAPLFQGGRLKAQRAQQAALEEQALWDYAGTALQAFQEVEVALRAERYLAGQEQALATATRESLLAEELAGERYASGLIDIITLLEAQRRAFDSQRALIDVRNQRLQNRINLHLALGGDFNETPPASPSNKEST